MAENNTKQDEAKIRREKQSDMSRRSSWHFCKIRSHKLTAILPSFSSIKGILVRAAGRIEISLAFCFTSMR